MQSFEALSRMLWATIQTLKSTKDLFFKLVVRAATLPYYRLYHFNTAQPLQNIADVASKTPPEQPKILGAVLFWRARKLAELQFISIASTVLAAAVIGAFSWTTIEEAHWLTHGFWHSSLILSVLSILLSASEITVLHLLGPIDPSCKLDQSERATRKYYPLLVSPTNDSNRPYVVRRKMIFVWQSPLMFMSYSVCTFLAGLTLLVCTPFIRHNSHWTPGHSIAVMYLTVFAGAGVVFMFCSFWVYHYLESDFDSISKEGHMNGRPSQPDAPALGDVLLPFAETNPVAHHNTS